MKFLLVYEALKGYNWLTHQRDLGFLQTAITQLSHFEDTNPSGDWVNTTSSVFDTLYSLIKNTLISLSLSFSLGSIPIMFHSRLHRWIMFRWFRTLTWTWWWWPDSLFLQVLRGMKSRRNECEKNVSVRYARICVTDVKMKENVLRTPKKIVWHSSFSRFLLAL